MVFLAGTYIDLSHLNVFWNPKYTLTSYQGSTHYEQLVDKFPKGITNMTSPSKMHNCWMMIVRLEDLEPYIMETHCSEKHQVSLSICSKRKSIKRKEHLIKERMFNTMSCPPHFVSVKGSCLGILMRRRHPHLFMKCPLLNEDKYQYIHSDITDQCFTHRNLANQWLLHLILRHTKAMKLRVACLNAMESSASPKVYAKRYLESYSETKYQTFWHRASHMLCEMDVTRSGRECPNGTFVCNDKTCIQQANRCDGKFDCLDFSDEANCSNVCFTEMGSKYVSLNSTFCSSQCSLPSCQCSHLYFKCTLVGCINTDKVCDGTFDCTDKSDETFCMMSLSDLPKTHFPIPWYSDDSNTWDCTEESCLICDSSQADSSYFLFEHMCIYEKHSDGELAICPHGEHLYHCDEFDCLGMYKCYHSHCLPIHRVCDGVWDCAYGEEEEKSFCDTFNTCPGFFKCSEGVCVNLNNLCDGFVHCQISLEDEKVCLFTECPTSCHCEGASADCEGLNPPLKDIPSLPYVRKFFGANNSLTLNEISFKKNVHDYLVELDLSYNNIKELSNEKYAYLKVLKMLLYLDISSNSIAILHSYSFKDLSNLRHLVINDNPLEEIKDYAFHDVTKLPSLNISHLKVHRLADQSFEGLQELEMLDISANVISTLPNKVFVPLKSLKYLYVNDNPLETIGEENMESFSYLHTISSADDRACCIAKSVLHCNFHTLILPSGCKHLLKTSLQVVLGIILCASLISCALALLYRIMKLKSNSEHHMKKMSCGHDILLISSVIADSLSPVYLLMLVSANVTYSGKYAHFSSQWRQSVACKAMSVLSMQSVFASHISLTLLAVYRLCTIASAEMKHWLSGKKCLVVSILIWTLLSTCFVSLITLNKDLGDGLTDSCIFMLPYAKAQQIHLWLIAIFILVLVVLSIVSAASYAFLIVYIVNISRKLKAMTTSSGSSGTRKPPLNIILTIVTNILQSATLIVGMALSFSTNQQLKIHASWYAVSMLPLGSVVNFLIFSLKPYLSGRKKN